MNFFKKIWDDIPVAAQYWIVIGTILLLILGILVLTFESTDAKEDIEFQRAYVACADAKALGEFKSVDWSVEECIKDAIAYLHALHGEKNELHLWGN